MTSYKDENEGGGVSERDSNLLRGMAECISSVPPEQRIEFRLREDAMTVRYFCGYCRASFSSMRELIRHDNNAHDRLGRLQAEKELAKSLLGRGQISDDDLHEMIADINYRLRDDYR